MNTFPFGPPEPPEPDRCSDCGSKLEREMERDKHLCVNCQAERAGCNAFVAPVPCLHPIQTALVLAPAC